MGIERVRERSPVAHPQRLVDGAGERQPSVDVAVDEGDQRLLDEYVAQTHAQGLSERSGADAEADGSPDPHIARPDPVLGAEREDQLANQSVPSEGRGELGLFAGVEITRERRIGREGHEIP